MTVTTRTLSMIATAALLLGAGPAPLAAADAKGATCELEGTFKTTPSLKTDPVKMRYTIKGRANDCRWTDGSTQSGDFTASGTGVASCASGVTNGVARIRWDDHGVSTMTYTTTNTYNVVRLDGTFTKGPSKGFAAHGLLVFVVDINEPVGCLTEFGLNRATFYGVCERDRVQ